MNYMKKLLIPLVLVLLTVMVSCEKTPELPAVTDVPAQEAQEKDGFEKMR